MTHSCSTSQVDPQHLDRCREVNARWQPGMAALSSDGGDPGEGSSGVPEVFHLADQLRAAGLPADPRPRAGNRSADRPPTVGPVRSRPSLRRGHDDGER
jgi:hypothetical protein